MSAQSKLDDVALRSLAARFRRDYSLDSPHRPHPYDIADALEELANLRLDRYHTSLNQLRGSLQEVTEKVSSLQAQLSQVQAERDRWHDERNALLSAVESMHNAEDGASIGGNRVSLTEATWQHVLTMIRRTTRWNHQSPGSAACAIEDAERFCKKHGFDF